MLPTMLSPVPSAPMQPFYSSAPMQTFVPRHTPIRYKPGTSVYVRSLANDVVNDKLREEFESYGRILQAKVVIYTY